MSFEEYQDLQGTGYQGGSGEATAPEDEFFHSVYISGKPRDNHLGIKEQSGKFQVRGVEYNLDEVNLVITHTKDILVKVKQQKGKGEITECFSYKEGAPPWHGTTPLSSGGPRPCPMTSAERAANDFCNPCRAQILLAGIYCKSDGSPILTEEKKPVFVFIRGRGMRYSNVSDYLNDLYNEEELSPVFEPVTDQSKAFEKSVVNNKRFVTKVTSTEEESSYGNMVNIFVLERGPQIPNTAVLKILKLSKETVEQFNEKFDWSKRKQTDVSGYGSGGEQAKTPPDGVMSMEDEQSKKESPSEDKQEGEAKTFSFDDIQF
jgi:hypothetical protein